MEKDLHHGIEHVCQFLKIAEYDPEPTTPEESNNWSIIEVGNKKGNNKINLGHYVSSFN